MKLVSKFDKSAHSGYALQLMTPWEEEYDSKPHNLLKIHFWKYSLRLNVPQFIKPRRKYVDLTRYDWATLKEDGTKGYWESIRKCFGFSFTPDSVHIHYGIQPGSWSRDDPKNSDHTKLFWYPWNYEHIRHTVYDRDGNYAFTGKRFQQFKEETCNEGTFDLQPVIPGIYVPIYNFYTYTDIDGELVPAKVNIEEREWRRGIWKWLRFLIGRLPGCHQVRRYIEIEFKSETGKRKGSYKGGTIGMSFTMLLNETIDQCWERFCKSKEKP